MGAAWGAGGVVAEAGVVYPLVRQLPNRQFSPLPTNVREPPHGAVARVVVDEGEGRLSFGSGVLVDVREEYGLVVTNWHVVRDAQGSIEVLFPDGFRSLARALKVDQDWDLAALVIWRPATNPAPLATVAPQPGDQLTICGYGAGVYRAATGCCTRYYSPGPNLPEHVVELDAEARQGDSGGPIFNARGEVAGVLFGASSGTTLGSFGGRVCDFLSTLTPHQDAPLGKELGRLVQRKSLDDSSDAALPNDPSPRPVEGKPRERGEDEAREAAFSAKRLPLPRGDEIEPDATATWEPTTAGVGESGGVTGNSPISSKISSKTTARGGLFGMVKNFLAVVGALALVRGLLRLAG